MWEIFALNKLHEHTSGSQEEFGSARAAPWVEDVLTHRNTPSSASVTVPNLVDVGQMVRIYVASHTPKIGPLGLRLSLSQKSSKLTRFDLRHVTSY